MKVLVCGSRKWVDPKPVERELRKLPPGTVVIHGGCRGADNVSGGVARSLGFPVRVYPADWDQFGRAAGHVRNQQMLDEEHTESEPIDLVLAFHKDPNLGRGTRDMVARSRKAGIEVQTFRR